MVYDSLVKLTDDSGNDQRHLHLLALQALHGAPDDRYLCLIVDQFEEVFTLCRDEECRKRFIENLLYASPLKGGRVVVILAMRADFYGRCAAYPDLAASVADHQMLVSPLDEEGLRRAIEEPAELVRLNFESGLADRLLEDVLTEPGALPLLQHALLELWKEKSGRYLTFDAYKEIGGIKKAIAHRADSIYESFSYEQQAITQRIMLRLTQPGEGGTYARRRVGFSELLRPGGKETDVKAVVDQLEKARLVTIGLDERENRIVDVAHEALIQGWPRLQQWLDDERDSLRILSKLRDPARDWEENHRDEDYLYRGVWLAEAEKWAKAHPGYLNPHEEAFLKASTERRDKRRQVDARTRRVIAAMGFLAVVFGLVAGALWLTSESRRIEAQRMASLLLADSAQQALQDGDTDLAVTLALYASETPHHPKEVEAVLAEAVYTPGTRRRIAGHTDTVWSVAFGPDGQRALSGSHDGTVRLWDVETGNEIGHRQVYTSAVRSVAFSPDGSTTLSGLEDGRLIVWDTQTGELVKQLYGCDGSAYDVAFSPDGGTFASGCADGRLIVWDVSTWDSTQLEGHKDEIWSIAFSPDSKMILSGSADWELILWSASTKEEIRRFSGHASQVLSVAFSPDDQTALSGSADGTSILWDVTDGSITHQFKDHTNWVWDVAFSPDGETAVTASADGSLILWDVNNGGQIRRFLGHSDEVHSVAFSPDGQRLLSGSRDESLRLWDIYSGESVRTLSGHSGTVSNVIFVPQDDAILSSSYDHRLILWDSESDNAQRFFDGHSAPVRGLAVGPDGLMALSGGGDNDYSLRVWDLENGKEAGTLSGHTNWVTGIAYSPSDGTALSGSHDHSMILWNPSSGEKIHRFEGHSDWVTGVAFRPDGDAALSTSSDGSFILWDVIEHKEIYSDVVSMAGIWSVAFSSDGRKALFGTENGNLVLWDLEGRQEIRRLLSHQCKVWSVAFSPDGHTALSGSEDGNMILWDVESGIEIHRFPEDPDGIASVAFSPDGLTAASGSVSGTIRLWRIDALDALIAWAHGNRYVRDLTCAERERYGVEPLCAEGNIPTAPIP